MALTAARTACLLLACGLAASGPALALDAPRKLASYDIKVSLDPTTRSVTGSETLRWTNPSGDRIPRLMFHLYWNAFRNNRSSFFKESGGKLRGDEADKDTGWGSIDVTSMTWGDQDLSKGFRFESPDDGNADDRTVLTVDLPRPVEPNETIELSIAWKAVVPKVFARAGYVRDFYMFGQWFPKIGVYQPAGLRRSPIGSWNCHQYHANSEFYADFGDYRVAITVPESFVVVSAGKQVDEKKASGKKTLTFVQDRIHDFAWSADPRYVLRTATFDPKVDVPESEVTRAAQILGRTAEDLRRGFTPVKLTFAMQPDHPEAYERYLDSQKWALVWFGLYAFPYPYEQVTCIDTPEDGEGASGMEYQTIYTGGTSRRQLRWPLDKMRLTETVAIHEFGHGYWMGLVASNEFEESWMDEGINTFTEVEMVTRRYGHMIGFPFGVGFTTEDINRASISTSDYDPIIEPSWKYRSNNSYGRNSYPRPAVAIQQIRKLVGEEKFWRGFRNYSERWRFDHPTSEDFFDAILSSAAPPTSRGAGKPEDSDLRDRTVVGDSLRTPEPIPYATLRSFIDRTWYGTDFFDVQVLSASCEPYDELTGYDDAGKPRNFTPGKKEKDKGKDKEKSKKKGKDDDDKPFDSRVVIGRDGEIGFPVDVLLTFKNGKTHRTTWDGHGKWLKLSTVYPSRLVKVEVDPDRKLLLDKNPFNNSRYLEGWKGPSAARKVKAYGFHLLQILLSSLWIVS